MNCPISELNEHEIRLIAEYKSRDPNIGYNIQAGGTGKFIPKENYNVNDDVRKKMSISHGKTSDNVNINPVYRKDILVGYKGKRRENGVQHEKIFSSTKYSVEENFKMCNKWVLDIKNDIIDSKKENANNVNLPKNISQVKDKKGNICGYRAIVHINKVRHDRTFQEGDSMEDKLAKAIEYKNQILNK